jgi:hypothetical protein
VISSNMSQFFLSKNVAKIGDDVEIYGACLNSGSVFQTSDTLIANMYSSTTIRATDKGEVNISQVTTDCDNSGSLLLSITED